MFPAIVFWLQPKGKPMLDITVYQKATDFLTVAQTWLEQDEVCNTLLLGVTSRLVREPDRLKTQPFLATVTDETGVVAAAMITPPLQLIASCDRTDFEPCLRLIVDAAYDAGFDPPGVLGQIQLAESLARLASARNGKSCHQSFAQRVFELRQVKMPPQLPSGQLRVANEGDVPLIADWMEKFQVEALGRLEAPDTLKAAKSRIATGDIYVWEIDNTVVTMASRARPTTHGCTVNMVYTPPELRGKGYASACVALLSQHLLDSGYDFCTLFTDLANPTSNSIYQKIGYVGVADFAEYRFD
jgi:uncharacterized protein